MKLCRMICLLPLLLAALALPAHAPAQTDLPIDIAILNDPLDVLRLVNRDNLLGKNYPDQSVDIYRLEKVTVPVIKGTHLLRPVANQALTELFDAARALGIELYVGSSHRKYRNQEVIHYNRVKRMGYDDGYSQIAGASEHQTGLAADVVSEDYFNVYEPEFGDTAEGIWLQNNCARFGFIIRYPRDKEDITGVHYEPWHIRYVGKEVAAYIMDSGMAFEEFSAERIRTLGTYYGDVICMPFEE